MKNKMILIFLIVLFFSCQLKEGYVYEKIHDSEHLYYLTVRREVTHQEAYICQTEFYNGEDWETKWTQCWRTVFDYYEYSISRLLDGEDWIIKIHRSNEVNPKKILDKTNNNQAIIYVDYEVWEEYKIWSKFQVNKKRGDSYEDKNNQIEYIKPWVREPYNLTEYKKLEY